MNRLVHKVSTIVVGSGARPRSFRSLDELPEHLRKRLDDATGGENSATLLIADERGRQEILKSLRGQKSALDSRLISSLSARLREQRQQAAPRFRLSKRSWLEIGLLAVIAVTLWLLAAGR